MKDDRKTKKQLITELEELRQRIAEVEGADLDRVQIEDTLRDSEERWRALTQNTTDFIVIADKNRTVQYINKAISPETTEDVIGKKIDEYMPDEHREVMRDTLEKVFSTGGPDTFETLAESPLWGSRWWHVQVIPIKSDTEVSNVILINREITEQRQAEAGLRKSNKNLAEAQQIAHLGSWEWDVESDLVSWSDEMYRIYGVDREELSGQLLAEMIFELTHLDDLDQVKENAQQAFEEGEVIPIEYRIIRSDGSLRYVYAQGDLKLDGAGKPLKMVGIVQDITKRVRIEQEMKRKEAHLTEAQRMAHLGSYEFEAPDGEVIWSEETFRILDRDTSLGEPSIDEYLRIVHPEDRSLVENVVARAVNEKQPFDFEYRVTVGNGMLKYIQSIGEPVMDENGTVVRIVGTILDITDRIEAVAALRESEERYRDLYENAPNAYFSVGTNGIIRKCNKHAGEMLGYAVEDLVGRRVLELYANTPYGKEKASQIFERFQSGEAILTERLQMQRADGTHIWINLTVNAVRDDKGQIVESRSMVVDITEQVQTEDALRESEERYRKISALSSDFAASYWIDPDDTQKVEWATEAFLRITGYSPEEIAAGGGIASVAHTEDKEILERRQRDLLAGKPVTSEFRILTKSGEVVWLRDFAISDWGVPEGRVVRIYGAAKDITEQVHAEQVSQESEERFRRIFEEGPLGMSLVGQDFKIIRANETLCKMLGYSEEELTSMTFPEFTYPEDIEIDVGLANQVFSGEIPFYKIDKRFIKKNGEIRLATLTASTIRDDQGNIIYGLGMIEDITEQSRSEKALRESEIRYRSLFKNMLNGFIYCKLILDKNGDVADVELLEVNKVFETTTGISRDQIAGMKLSEVVPGLNEATPELFEKYAKVVLAGESVELEEYIGPLDQWFHVMVFSPEEGYAVAIFEDITPRKRAEEELRRNSERLATLREIDQAILAAESPSDIARSAIDQLGKLVGAERISVTLFDFLEDVNIISSVEVTDQTEMGVGARIPLRDIVMGEEFEQGLVHRVDEIEALEHPSPVDIQLLREGVKSYINVPLMVQNKLTGSLNLGASEKGAFTEGQVEIACEVADSLAIALQQARLFEQIKLGRDRLQLLSRRLVEGQEAERRYIAQELHDEVGQVLTSLKLSLQMNKDRLPEQEQIEFKETEDLIDVLLKQVRDLSLDLRPAMLDDLGLLPALLWQLERFEIQTGVVVTFEHSGLADRHLLPEIETAAYRIVQEALTNVARHAQAETVEVQAHYGKDLLTIEIEDEGVGFDVATSRDAAVSLGLVGMEERATMLGGSIKIDSVAGKGTKVRADIPLGGTLERRRVEREQ